MHPVLIKIGPLTVYTYGVFVSAAFALSAYLMWYNAPLRNFQREKVLDFVVVILISGIIGARLLYVILNLDYFKKNPIEIVMLNRGGLAFHGGLLFSFFGGIYFLLKNSIPLRDAGDLVAPYAALGQSIGRIGCFFNGCCIGKPGAPYYLGFKFLGDQVYRHPVQLYEAAILLILHMLLRFMLQKNILKHNLFFFYLTAYSFERFFMDFLRADLPNIFMKLTLSQIFSVIILFIGFAAIVIEKIYFGKKNGA